jgi:hypothetical protein
MRKALQALAVAIAGLGLASPPAAAQTPGPMDYRYEWSVNAKDYHDDPAYYVFYRPYSPFRPGSVAVNSRHPRARATGAASGHPPRRHAYKMKSPRHPRTYAEARVEPVTMCRTHYTYWGPQRVCQRIY